MTESDYWIDLSNRQSNHLAYLHESEMNRAVEAEEFHLFKLLNPKLSIDGNQYEVLYGPNPMEGVVGYGDSPYLAILDWNKAWKRKDLEAQERQPQRTPEELR